MFVCLCTGTTTNAVSEVVANGARTCREIAKECGAGSDCGRCRRTLRALITAHAEAQDCVVPESVSR